MKIEAARRCCTLRGANNYAAIAEGYHQCSGGWCILSLFPLEQVWIDNKLVINNEGDVKVVPISDNCVALAKGLHPIEVRLPSQYRWWLAFLVEQPQPRNAQG